MSIVTATSEGTADEVKIQSYPFNPSIKLATDANCNLELDLMGS